MEKGYLSLKEAAEYMGVTTTTLRGYIKRGWIPAAKLDRAVLIKKDELEEALKDLAFSRRLYSDERVDYKPSEEGKG